MKAQKLRLIGRCNDGRLTLEELDTLYAHDREISYDTFARHVDVRALAAELGYAYGNQEKGVRLSKDPYVLFYRSHLRGKPCYHLDWSCIDHVFQ